MNTIAPGFEGRRDPLAEPDGVLEVDCPRKGLVAGERCLALQEQERCACACATDPVVLAEHRLRIASSPAPAREGYGLFLSFDDRRRIIGQLNEGYTAREVATHFGISMRHVERLKHAQREHQLEPRSTAEHPLCVNCQRTRVRDPGVSRLCSRCRARDDRSLAAP